MAQQSKFTAIALALACLAGPAMAAEYDFDGAVHSMRAGRQGNIEPRVHQYLCGPGRNGLNGSHRKIEQLTRAQVLFANLYKIDTIRCRPPN